MTKVNALLAKRLKKEEKSSKMAEMAKQSASGNLTSFSGVFSIGELNKEEKDFLESLLSRHTKDSKNLTKDLESLATITAEIKAINNQAALLHGERIKQAQKVLKSYQEGAFTSWLIATYGNRQTPYNFLQYYEFYTQLPQTLRPRIESMPRQAIYTLASREGSLELKRKMVEEYQGETKTEMLAAIRELFPLKLNDRRKENIGENTAKTLKKLISTVRSRNTTLLKSQKRVIFELIDELYTLVDECKTK